MSEDNIDDLLLKIIDFVEQEDLPHDWPDDDALYSNFKEMLYAWSEPFLTKERNYN